jgi:hypothetical protein
LQLVPKRAVYPDVWPRHVFRRDYSSAIVVDRIESEVGGGALWSLELSMK